MAEISVEDGYLLNWVRAGAVGYVMEKLIWEGNTLIKVSEEVVMPDDEEESVTEEETIDLSDYTNCSEEDFIEQTGLQLTKEYRENGVDYVYIGYDECFRVEFAEDKVLLLNITTEIPGYTFKSIESGMEIEEAIYILEEQGYIVSYDETGDYVTFDIEEGSVTIHIIEEKVEQIMAHYYW